MVAPYPWQAEQWQKLTQAAQARQLGHANLFSGRPGVGHHQFAVALAKFLLCEAKLARTNYCGNCRGCALFDAGNHPDLMQVMPEEAGKGISIDQVRALTGFYSLKPHYGGNKVALVSPAENMNRAASNAILKTLEEPPAQAVLILITERFDAIPMTIRSRCQRVAFEHVDQLAAKQWLREQHEHGASSTAVDDALSASLGAPLKATELVASEDSTLHGTIVETWNGVATGRISPLKATRNCDSVPLGSLFEELLRFNYLLILAQFGLTDPFNEDRKKPDETLKASLNGLNLKDLYKISDVITEAKSLVFGPTNVRDSDLLDSFWVALDRIYRTSNGA